MKKEREITSEEIKRFEIICQLVQEILYKDYGEAVNIKVLHLIYEDPNNKEINVNLISGSSVKNIKNDITFNKFKVLKE